MSNKPKNKHNVLLKKLKSSNEKFRKFKAIFVVQLFDFILFLVICIILRLIAFVQDKDTQSKDAETAYNRLDTMANRTQDITKKYWILNDQYRLLNTTIVAALEKQEKLQFEYKNSVG